MEGGLGGGGSPGDSGDTSCVDDGEGVDCFGSGCLGAEGSCVPIYLEGDMVRTWRCGLALVQARRGMLATQ